MNPRFPALALVLVVLAAPAQGSVVLDRPSAVAALVTELALSADSVQVWCPPTEYGLGHPGLLPTGTKVRPEHPGAPPYAGTTVTLTQPMYVFLIDDHPFAGYSHRVRFAYVDATVASPTLAAGTIHVDVQGWWPVIQQLTGPEESFFGPGGRLSDLPSGPENPDGLVFGLGSQDALLPPAWSEIPGLGAAAVDYSKACVLLATGADSSWDDYGKSVGRSMKRLRKEFEDRGVPQGRIYNRYRTSKNELRSRINALCNTNPPCEKIFVYLGAHGSAGNVCLKEVSPVPVDTLCSILAPLGEKTVAGKPVPVCFLLESCYAGTLVPKLRPKFPRGIILTASDSWNWCYGGPISGVGRIGNFSYLLMQCWNAPEADTAQGVGNGDGTVDWSEAMKWVCTGGRDTLQSETGRWSMKALQHPEHHGLPPKLEQWGSPATGWFSEWWADTDQNGMYDQCIWYEDRDCDGTVDQSFTDQDYDGDGQPDTLTAYADVNDDGIKDTRYLIIDTDKDGKPDQATCSSWTGTVWNVNASVSRRTENAYQISGTSGSKAGGQTVSMTATGTFWAHPNVVVFIGSQARAATRLSPVHVTAVTGGYFPGSVDVIVADFNPGSPSAGFDLLTDGFTYTPELFIEDVEPNQAPCTAPGIVTIRGCNFDPAAVVRFGAVVVSSTWINSHTMEATPPPCGSPGPVSVSVENPDLMVATVSSGFLFLSEDVTPPAVFCPPPLVLDPGPDNLARTPPGWTATATDGGNPVAVLRNHRGALSPGNHTIVFEAIDAAGNRNTCSVLVQVTGSGGVDPTLPAAFTLAPPHPNPFSGEVTFRVALPSAVAVKLQVISVSGELVATLADRRFDAGSHDLRWSGLRDDGARAANGVYLVRLLAGDFRAAHRALLIR